MTLDPNDRGSEATRTIRDYVKAPADEAIGRRTQQLGSTRVLDGKRTSPTLLVRLIVPTAILLVWQVAAQTGLIDVRLFSSPLEIVGTLAGMVTDGSLVHNILPSLRRAGLGLALGLTLGVAFATVSGLWRIGEATVDLTVQILRSVPFVALTSLYIVWFGFGETPKVLLIATACFFPIYINVFAGIRSVDSRLIEMARTIDMPTSQVIRHILLPGSTASTLVGLRYAMTTSILALVIAETINATSGIGYLMDQARRYLDTPLVFACLVIYCILGIIADLVVRTLTSRLLVWQKGFEGR